MNSAWSLTAQWVFPADQPPIKQGVIHVAGDRIVAVEPPGASKPDVEFGQAAILPGFVNVHTHLDLTALRGRCPPQRDFTEWLRGVIAHRRAMNAEATIASIRAGLAACMRYGTTLVGDISSQGLSWADIASAEINAVVHYELLGLTNERAAAAWAQADAWLNEQRPTTSCRPGLSPHAPYSVRADLLRKCASRDVPITIHLAETTDELTLLQSHHGSFVRFLQELNVWDPCGLAANASEVLQLVDRLSPTILAHGNYLSARDPIPKTATVVYCPRTHAAFGHAPHPFREFMARGVNVALGTDSLASNPDLDILAEARFVNRHYPDCSGPALLRMITISGAAALGWDADVGSLRAGKLADLVVVPIPNTAAADPHELVFGTAAAVSAVLWHGQWRASPSPAPLSAT